MDSKKVLKVILITVLSLFGVFVLLILGLWVYREKYITTVGNTISSPSMPVYDSSGKESSISKDSILPEQDSSIIRTSLLTVEVKDMDKYLKDVKNISDKYSGEYVSYYDYGTGKDKSVALTIKVKESDFDSASEEIRDLETDKLTTSLTTNDVTDTVVDLEARLRNYQSVEAQLQEVLKSAKSVADTLAVYKELNEVRTNIDLLETEIKNLDKQVKYSYITISVFQSSTGASLTDEEWKPLGVLKDALRALVSFGKFLGSVIIWAVVFIPVIAVFVVPIVLIQKRAQK